MKSSEPDFRALFERLPGLYVLLTPDAPRYTIVAASDAFVQHRGRTREAIVGRGLFEVFPDDPHARVQQTTAASLARVVAARGPDLPQERSDAVNERWWRSSHTPVFDPEGKLTYILHHVEDITEFIDFQRASLAAHRQGLELQAHAERMESELLLQGRQLRETSERFRKASDELARLCEQAISAEATFNSDLSGHISSNTPDEGPRDMLAPEPLRPYARQDKSARGSAEDLASPTEKLRLSELRLRALFEGAPDSSFIASHDGRISDINRVACHMLGYPREELIGRPVADLLAPGDAPRLVTVWQRLLDGRVELAEWRLRRKDGIYVLVELSAKLLPDGRWLAVWRDITARREAEDRLSISEAKFSGIVSISADAILSIDEDQRITFVNESAEKLFGYTSAELLGAPLDLLIPERLRGVHHTHVKGFAAGVATARRMGERKSSIVGLRKNGEEFQVDAAISKINVAGRTLLTVVLHDVTEQKLLEHEERFLSEVGAVLATTLDYQETLTSIARLALHLADWCTVHAVNDEDNMWRSAVSCADLTKQPFADALQRFDHSPALVREVLASRESMLVPAIPREALADLDDEYRRLVEGLGATAMMAVPIVAHDRVLGVLVAVAATSRRRFGPFDLRLLKALGQRAALSLENARLFRARQQAIEARDSVLGVVAHDLRNPLNTILLQAQYLRRLGQDLSTTQRERFAEVVIRAAKQMDHLIQDLLDVTRAEAGNLPLACRAVAPDRLVTAVVETQKALLTDAGLDLRLDLATDLPDVWADPERLHQVFGNLVGNALKFTPRGGQVTIGTAPRDGHVLFRVDDTGSGISENLLPHVFDRFWQAKQIDRRGAGLGLAIARSIVEAHGGTITVESQVGHGTSFCFTVPLAPRADVSSAPGAPSPQ